MRELPVIHLIADSLMSVFPPGALPALATALRQPCCG
jgi:hypothetical protein